MDWQSLRSRLLGDLLAGFAFFLPLLFLVVAFYGIFVLVLGVGSRVVDFLALLGVRGVTQAILAVTVVLVVTPALFALTGATLRHRYGERASEAVDWTIVRIPGLGPVYHGLKQSREVVLEDGGGFEDVVSLELADGVDVLAFVVGRESGANWTSGDRRVTVYIPLCPNPTLGGHLLAVSPERVTETSLSVRAGLTILVTAGASGTDEAEPPLSGLYRTLGAKAMETDDEALSKSTE